MNNTGRALVEQPYSERQLIVVTDDAVVQATRMAEKQVLEQQQSASWSSMEEITVRGLIDYLAASLGEATLESLNVDLAIVEAVQSWFRGRASGLRILQVGRTEAQDLRFPPGHPREGVLYIGHPALANVYYTIAEFHRVTFEHKFCEAIELLMHLGASKIRVEHVRGWSQKFSARLSVPLGPTESLSTEEERQERKQDQLLYEATLVGTTKATLPERMVWYPHEPTWQSIANGRIKFGLCDFSLSVSYEDDFGVNAGLKASVQKIGLELGGRFEDHVSTIWRISGQFGAT
jgi:hypothetical protein